MERKRVMSLGNGCESKVFFTELNMDAKGILDGTSCTIGALGIKSLFDGSFFKAVENRDVVKSAEVPEEEAFVDNFRRSNCFPILKVQDFEFLFPHITYYSFLQHMDERAQALKDAINDPTCPLAVSNSKNPKFWFNKYVYQLIQEWAPQIKDRLIAVSLDIEPELNFFNEAKIPVIDAGFYRDFYTEGSRLRTLYFKALYDEFSEKYPQLASTIVLPTI